MIKFGIIGAGWRSEFYLRIAALLPSKFSVSGIYIRNIEKQKEFADKYNVKICSSLEALLKTDFDFIVSCVNKDNISEMIKTLAANNIPVLTETPVTDGSLKGRVQVAEQFHFMPRNQAYKRIIESGILGTVHSVRLSCCHDYHAASLIRFFLDTGFEKPEITSISITDPVTRYNSRAGYLKSPAVIKAEEKIKIFKFKDRTAVYDFSFEQYFSDIRSSQLTIRGTNGEIVNNTCSYLKDGVPQRFDICRNAYGTEESLDGMCLFNITGNGKVLYTNPFPYSRLSDEEIAIATCLVKMKEYLDTGKEFYSAKDACFDYTLFE